MIHSHAWYAVPSLGRFRCDCGAQGYKPGIIAGQHRSALCGVKPYVCKFVTGDRKTKREMCGADAVHVTGDRGMSRCSLHLSPLVIRNSPGA